MKKLNPKNYLPQLLKLLLAFFMCLPMWASSLRAQDQPYAEYDGYSETLTFRYGAKPAGAYDLNEGNATPRWWYDLINTEDPKQHNKINKVVFDASFANARPTSCHMWFVGCSDLTEIEGIENLNTEEVTNMGYMFYGCSSLTSLNVSNFDTQNVTDMSYMFSACSGLKSLNVSNFDTQNVKNMSNMFYSCRSLTSLDVSKFNTQKVEYMHAMFSWCEGLHSLNLSKFDTQNVKDMSNMFYSCEGLTSLDVSKFNTQKVENMHAMFSWCEGLHSLDLSKFDTQNVKNMSRMFWSSSALKTIYVSDKFVTTKVSNGSEMFKDCTSLKGAIDYDASKIDPAYANCGTGYFTPGCAYAEFDEGTGTLTFKCGLSKPEGAYDLNEGANTPAWIKKDWSMNDHIKNVVFDASFANARPTSCNMWFIYCNNLTKIEGIENLNTVNVTSMSNMFSGCSALTSLDLSKFDTQNVTDMRFMFSDCSSLTSLDLSNFDTQSVKKMNYMFSGCSKLTLLNLSKFNTQNVTGMYGMFSGCSGLTSLDLSNFNTQNVTGMTSMFSGCSGLTSLDLSKFDTQKVTTMGYMFNGCSALTTIYVSNKFVTTNVGFGDSMFSGCTLLKGATVYDDSNTNHTYANYNTGYFTLKPSTAYAVFNEVDGTLTFRYDDSKPAGAYDLNEGANIPAWIKKDWSMNDHIKNVVFDASFANARPTSCNMWFIYCNNLTKIEGIENLNTVNVTAMYGMFYGCSGLTSLNLSKFNTQNVTSMSNMFSGCSALTSLDLSKFDTQNVIEMNGMFDGCSVLTSLDLSKFDTQKVTDMAYMFSGCSALTTIYVSDKFVTTKVSDGSEMFEGCTSLKGAIVYDASNTDHTYANYETGYFTKLVGKNGNDKIGAVGEVLTAESLALADDKDFEAYEPFTAKTATYTRTLKEGTSWATLCLPFNVELEGQNFRAFNLLSAADGIIKLQEVETSIEAGKPVVIKMNEGENTLSFTYSGTTIAPEAQTVQASENSGYKLTGIYTQKVFDKTADNNCFIIKGGSLMNPAMVLSKTSTQIVGTKPFRAYMQEDGTEGGARAFSLSFEGEATAINTLNGVDADNAEYYDLQGRRINSLQKGINIIKHGGKATKILIR